MRFARGEHTCREGENKGESGGVKKGIVTKKQRNITSFIAKNKSLIMRIFSCQ